MKLTWKVILLIMLAGFVGWRVMAQEPQGTRPSSGQPYDPNELSGGQQSNPAAQTNSGVPISGAVTLTPGAGRGGETDATVKGGADGSDLTITAVPMTSDELSKKLEKARQIASQMESASIHRANEARLSMERWDPADVAGRDRLRKELRLFVMRAFEARHALQRMEVDLLAMKLQAMDRKLDEQGTNASEIIERRIDDLLNPNLRWDDSAIKNSTTEGNGPKAAVPNDVRLYAVQDLPLWSKDGTSQHIELLIHYLETRVDSTKNGGDMIGSYDPGRGMLVVRGDGRKQRQIAQLIAELREMSGQPVEDLATFNSIVDLGAGFGQRAEDLAKEKSLKTYSIADLPIWSKDGKKQHVDLLLSYLRFNVDPPSWESKATRAAYNAEMLALVVQGTPEVHDGIKAALSRLRALDLPTEQRLEKPLDRKNARAVVEAFVAAILAGDRETAQSLAKVRAVDISDLANGLKVKRLAIETVHIGGPEKPKDVNAFAATASALAISEPVQLEGRLRPPNHTQRDGFLLFTLDMGEVGWSVNNIIFESAEGANRELRKFIEANPNSVRMSSPGGEHTVGPAGNVLAPANAVNPPAFERIQEAKAVSPPQLFGAKTPAGVLAYDGIVQEWIGGDRRAGTIWADGDALKSVPNATIHLYRVSPITKGGAGYQFEEIEVFNSDAQGRFKINIPDDLKRFIPTPGTKEWDDWESLLLVTTSAPGFATDSTTLAANRGLDSIELIRGTSIQGHLVDTLGKPVVGARITVHAQSRSSVEEMDEWLSQTSSKPLPEAKFDPSDTAAILAARKSASIANHGVQWIPTQIEGVVTDQDGRFTIDGIGPDDVLDLNVECFGYNNARIKVIGRDIETVYSRDPFSSGENIAVHGRTLQATLIASDRGSPHSRHRVIKGEQKKDQVEQNPSDKSAKDE